MNVSKKTIEYDLKTEDYQPFIIGDAQELLERMEAIRPWFPHSVKVFKHILQAQIQRHPSLEDWLIIPHYQFFWDANYKGIQWFEDLFQEAITLMGENSWIEWLGEVIGQTDCATTNAICDRLYDFQLQLYGGMYLAREGWSVHFMPPSNDEKRPDVIGMRKGQGCVLECKFVHASTKYESFWHRFNTASFKYSKERPRLLFCEQFVFPSSLKIKSLSPFDCALVKAFAQKAYKNPSLPQTGIFDGGSFTYRSTIPPAVVPIDVQHDFAQTQGDDFANKYLARLLEEAWLQLNQTELPFRKVLFIGLQPDVLYLAPWNESVIYEVKYKFISLANQKDIEAIFSEDVGFSVRGYS